MLLAASGPLITDVGHVIIPDIKRDIVVAQCSTAVSYADQKIVHLRGSLYTLKINLTLFKEKTKKKHYEVYLFFLENLISK